MNKISFPKSISLMQLETKVNDVFSMAKVCHWSSSELSERCNKYLTEPINEKYPSGKRKHSTWLAGYVSGLIAANRSIIWREHVEFCYLVDGVLYSTHKDSDKPTTEQFYERGEGNILADSEGRHYWKGTDRAFS